MTLCCKVFSPIPARRVFVHATTVNELINCYKHISLLTYNHDKGKNDDNKKKKDGDKRKKDDDSEKKNDKGKRKRMIMAKMIRIAARSIERKI